jgi:lauroyl/myristoyl acyltransferase
VKYSLGIYQGESMKRRISTWLGQIYVGVRYTFLKFAITIARALPMRIGGFLADSGADVSFLLSTRRRKNVTANLKHILGEQEDNHTLKGKTRKVFRNVARNYFDLTRVTKMSLNNIERKTTIEGWQNLIQARNRKQGVILATAHLGNFELGTQAIVNRGIEMTILVEDFYSNPFLRHIAKLRQRKGVRILPVNTQGMKDSYYDLIRGGTVTIVCDRDIQGNGMKIKFIGAETTLPFGAVSLALRTGAALVPIFSVRKPNNLTSIYIESPLDLVDSGNREESLRANLEKLAAVMEKYILKYPEQWAVLEPIW